MDKVDFDRFINAFGVMAEMFDKKASAILQAAYFKAMERFSISEVESAMSQAMGTCKFFPKPVELIDLITGGKEGLEAQAMTQATRALESLKRHGAYQSVAFDDPVTQAVIQYGFGGWIKLASEMRAENEGWFVKDFVKIYKAYRQQSIGLTGHLAGVFERDNSARGLFADVPPPALIGAAEIALQVARTPPRDALLSGPAKEIVRQIGMEVDA